MVFGWSCWGPIVFGWGPIARFARTLGTYPHIKTTTHDTRHTTHDTRHTTHDPRPTTTQLGSTLITYPCTCRLYAYTFHFARRCQVCFRNHRNEGFTRDARFGSVRFGSVLAQSPYSMLRSSSGSEDSAPMQAPGAVAGNVAGNAAVGGAHILTLPYFPSQIFFEVLFFLIDT